MRFSATVFNVCLGILFVLCGESIFAQVQYVVRGQMLLEQANYNDARIVHTVNKNTHIIHLNNDGTFQTSLDWNSVNFFSFEKPGYVSKIIEFSTFVPASISKSNIEPYNLQVKLFKVFEGVDTVFFKNPVAKILFNAQISDFEYDMDYSMQVKYKIDKMMQAVNEIRNTKSVNTASGKNIENKDKGGRLLSDKPLENKNDRINNNLQGVEKQQYKVLAPVAVPPLNENYQEGKTIESFELEKKTVVRIIIKKGNVQKVYLKVRHFWGAEYYFLDESPLSTTCITKKVFEQAVAEP
jgi:hypothetical protein